MANNKCSMCGASIKDNARECEYCGTKVTNDTNTNNNTSDTQASYYIRETFSGAKKTISNLKFNTGIFVLLLIFMPPIAIIYLFICMSNGNNTK